MAVQPYSPDQFSDIDKARLFLSVDKTPDLKSEKGLKTLEQLTTLSYPASLLIRSAIHQSLTDQIDPVELIAQRDKKEKFRIPPLPDFITRTTLRYIDNPNESLSINQIESGLNRAINQKMENGSEQDEESIQSLSQLTSDDVDALLNMADIDSTMPEVLDTLWKNLGLDNPNDLRKLSTQVARDKAIQPAWEIIHNKIYSRIIENYDRELAAFNAHETPKKDLENRAKITFPELVDNENISEIYLRRRRITSLHLLFGLIYDKITDKFRNKYFDEIHSLYEKCDPKACKGYDALMKRSKEDTELSPIISKTNFYIFVERVLKSVGTAENILTDDSFTLISAVSELLSLEARDLYDQEIAIPNNPWLELYQQMNPIISELTLETNPQAHTKSPLEKEMVRYFSEPNPQEFKLKHENSPLAPHDLLLDQPSNT